MKIDKLNKKHFDEIFKELVAEKSFPAFISTFNFADKLWKKFRIPYKKQADIVRAKMRAWWGSYRWRYEPRPHKMILGTAVHLGSPMGYDYCMLEPRQSLIIVYQNQSEFKKSSLKRFVIRRLPFADGGWAIFDKEKDDWYREPYQTKCFDKRYEAIKKANKLNGMG